nr:hypothetical protein [Tanacetum cinerariifolium]
MCELVCQIFQKKQEEKQIEEEQAAKARYWKIPACCDDDDDYDFAITPVLSTEETDNSLTKDHVEIVINSNDDISSSDDDSLYKENIEYVEASPHYSELVSLEVAEIVIPEVGGIDDDILLTIKDDIVRENLLNVNLLIPTIETLNDNPTPSSDCKTKSPSTSPKSFLEEANTFYNSEPEFENFCFDLEEISSGSTTTHSNISLSDYEVFYFDDGHIKEISSGSTTIHSDISFSEYDSFIFDSSNDQFSPTDRSDLTHEDFVDELAHIISPREYDCFYFWNLTDPGKLMSILNSEIHENLSTTRVNLPIEDDHSPLLAYVVWIFLAYLTILENLKTLTKGFYPPSLKFLSFNWESCERKPRKGQNRDETGQKREAMQTQTSNSLHNAIMEAGSKDRPPMLAPGNYIQWKSRIK